MLKYQFFTLISFLCLHTPICRLRLSSVSSAHVLCNQGGGWDVRLGRKRNNFARVGMKIFWHAMYCANPNPELESQSGSLSYKGLGR